MCLQVRDKAVGVGLGLVTVVHDAKLCLKRDNVYINTKVDGLYNYRPVLVCHQAQSTVEVNTQFKRSGPRSKVYIQLRRKLAIAMSSSFYLCGSSVPNEVSSITMVMLTTLHVRQQL